MNKNKDLLIQKINILLFSSLFFITNILTAYYKKYYLYSFLFCILTLTSLIYHSNNNIYTNIIDKIAIISIVLYGAFTLYNKMNFNKCLNCLIILISFLTCIYLFYYGFITKQYCFNNNKCIANNYHSILHIISSIGHHFIIFL